MFWFLPRIHRTCTKMSQTIRTGQPPYSPPTHDMQSKMFQLWGSLPRTWSLGCSENLKNHLALVPGSWCSGGNFRGSDHYENSYIQNWALGGNFFVEKNLRMIFWPCALCANMGGENYTKNLRMIFWPHALCANMGGENYTTNLMYLWIEIAQLIKGLQ